MGGELDAPRGSLIRRDTPSPSAFQHFRVTSLPRDPPEQGIPEHQVMSGSCSFATLQAAVL